MAITIAAAASLVNGLEDNDSGKSWLIQAFKQSSPAYAGRDVTVPWYGSSGALARQIQAGAINPDIFIAASKEAMDYAQNCSPDNQPGDTNMVTPDTRFDFIGNTLVIFKNNAGSGLLVNSFADVNSINFPQAVPPATPINHIWIANPGAPDYVPAGQYAQDAFTFVETWSDVIAKVNADTTMASDVQATLRSCLLDNLPAIGVVYNSDALGASRTVAAVAPPEINTTIIYPAAQINRIGQNVSEISDFLTFLKTPTAIDILTNAVTGYGYRELL
jgi:molybdenum ABC transporter molybdate-binding protein